MRGVRALLHLRERVDELTQHRAVRDAEQCRLDAVLVGRVGVAPRDGALVGIPNFGGFWLAHDDGAVASLGNDKWHRTSE